MAVTSENDLAALMNHIVEDHMQRHPELTASEEGVAALRALLLAGAERLANDDAVADPQALAAESTQILMDAVTEAADEAAAEAARANGVDAGGPHITQEVVSAAVARRCPIWPFCRS
jgi:hypothetical protein